MLNKSILLFIGGIAVGVAAGVLGTKKYFENKYQKRYEEDHAALEEYYQRTDEYARRSDQKEGTEDCGVDPVKGESRPGGRMTSEERAARKTMIKNGDSSERTNYAGMYKAHAGAAAPSEQELAEKEYPYDDVCENCSYYARDDETCSIHKENVELDDCCDDFKSIYETSSPEEDAFDDHQKNKYRSPKIISSEAYGNLPAHIEQEVLYFYAYDEVLTDDNEEPVEEPERLVGDALTKYGFVDNEERIIFVMNYSLDTCYEIQKVDSSWTDSH